MFHFKLRLMKKIILCFTIVAGILTSCLKDEYEFDNLSGVISPEIAIPIITTSIESDSNHLLDLFFSDTVEIDSLIFAHISSATIRVNVENEDAILNLRNSSKIIIVTKLGSSNNGSAVKIYSTYSMRIKLGLMAKVNFEL